MKTLILAILFDLAFIAFVNAQITNSSPDLSVTCANGQLPCTIGTLSPIVKHSEPTLNIDQTYVAKTLLRTCTPAACPTGMKDAIADPPVVGAQVSFNVCTMSGWDLIVAAGPVLNGSSWVEIEPWQCGLFLSDGTQYLVGFTWQASHQQSCPAGQHMVSGTPFKCN